MIRANSKYSTRNVTLAVKQNTLCYKYFICRYAKDFATHFALRMLLEHHVYVLS